MLRSKRLTLSLVGGALLLLIVAAGAVAASQQGSSHAPARVVHQASFGQILVTADQRERALYYFTPEKDGTIHCTGQCLKVWPPLLVPNGATVPTKVSGASGKFSIVTRPDKGRQVTYNGRPIYTYINDTKPLQVLCDGVDGWYVVRVRGH